MEVGNGYRCFKDTNSKYKMNESRGGRHSMVILVNDTVVAFL